MQGRLACLYSALVLALMLGEFVSTSAAQADSIADVQHSESAIARMSAPIRSRSDLENYRRHTRIAISPLRFLRPDARKEFISSLIFDDSGLTSFSYAQFGELTATQAYQILNLFGLQSSVGQLGNLKVVTPLDKLILSAHLHPGGIPNYITVPNPPPLRNQCNYFPNHYCYPS